MADAKVDPTSFMTTDTPPNMSDSSDQTPARAQDDRPKSLIDLPAELKKIIVDDVMEDCGISSMIGGDVPRTTWYSTAWQGLPLMVPLCKGMDLQVFAQEYLYKHNETWIETNNAPRVEMPPTHVLEFAHKPVFYGVPFKEQWPALAKLAVSDSQKPKFPNARSMKILFTTIDHYSDISDDDISDMRREMKQHPLEFKTNKLAILFRSYHSRGNPDGLPSDIRAVPSRYRRMVEQLFDSISIATDKPVVRTPRRAGKITIERGYSLTTAQVILETV